MRTPPVTITANLIAARIGTVFALPEHDLARPQADNIVCQFEPFAPEAAPTRG